MLNEYLMIATVLKPQGVRGECKIRSWAADINLFRSWKTLYLKKAGDFCPVSVRTTGIRDGFVYAFLNGSAGIDDAERFRGQDLYVDRAHAAPAEGDADLIADLIGCEAFDEQGVRIGALTCVLQYGTVDTWVFDTGAGTMMAPALRDVFPEVDAAGRRILVVRSRLEEVAVWS